MPTQIKRFQLRALLRGDEFERALDYARRMAPASTQAGSQMALRGVGPGPRGGGRGGGSGPRGEGAGPRGGVRGRELQYQQERTGRGLLG